MTAYKHPISRFSVNCGDAHIASSKLIDLLQGNNEAVGDFKDVRTA
jgi:hypothetical protein